MDNKKRSFSSWFSLRRLFLGGNIVLFLLFVIVIIKDQQHSWDDYQSTYKELEVNRAQKKLDAAATDEEKETALREIHAAKRMRPEIRQLWVTKMNAVDRCITCHLGHDPLANSSLTTP